MKTKHNFFISISIQISVFLVIIAFVPIAVTLMLNTYEKQQLSMTEASNVQQARLVAASLSVLCNSKVSKENAETLLKSMNGRFDARIRILDQNGTLIADSSSLISQTQQDSVDGEYPKLRTQSKAEPDIEAEETWIYKLFSVPIRFFRINIYRRYLRKYLKPPVAPFENADFYQNKNIYNGEEIKSALNGRYGAATRISSGGQVSVTLYSAVPVINSEESIIGVVLVSRSTYKILQNLYELRLDLGKVFLRSLIAVLFISLFLGFRIAVPLKKLSKQAVECTDKKGRILFKEFTGKKRHDEIGELSRSFSSLIEKLNNRIQFTEAFSADISHEFKNPLAAIRSSAELLNTQELNADESKQFNNAIIEEVSHLQTLLNGVRKISQIDSGSNSEPADSIPIIQFTSNIISRIKKNYPDNTIDFFHEDDEILFMFESDKYDRLMENLIENASSFSNNVFVSILKSNSQLLISVEDSGPGISPENIEKIFNRFYSNRPDKQKSTHTGLGLSIVKAIIDSSNGTINVDKSEKLGGAKFSITLPL